MTARSASTMAMADEPAKPVSQASRPGEAGERGQLLDTRRHIYVLKAVGARHDEAIEAALGKLRPQRRNARRTFGALAAILERLEVGFKHESNLRGRDASGNAGPRPLAADED